MKNTQTIINALKIDEFSATPKYQQLIDVTLDAIQKGILKEGDSMPSINELSFSYEISRVTVEKGYNMLRDMGVLASHHGKGYFVSGTNISRDLRIFLMFNKLSAHKKVIYDAFVETLGENAAIDFYVYNNDARLFARLLERKKGPYSHYVIIPHFIEGAGSAYKLINELPKDKLVLVDKYVQEISGNYSAVYESFKEDLFLALTLALERLQKYQTLKLVFPENSYYPQEIAEGFTAFCQNYTFHYKIAPNIEEEEIKKGEVYIILVEEDLVALLEKIKHSQLIVGSEVGIISYNETRLKQFIMNGLTTISTNFHAMGAMAAQLVLSNSKTRVHNPFRLTLRPSL